MTTHHNLEAHEITIGATYPLTSAPPHPASTAFRRWCESRVATRRANTIAACAPAATYYFAAAGNDATGSGTLASPWQSIAKATTMLATANTLCLFNRGDEWPSAVGLPVAGNQSSVGSYGDASLPEPMLHAFAHFIGTDAATGGGDGSPTPGSWFKEAGATNRWTYKPNRAPATIIVGGNGAIGGAAVAGTYLTTGLTRKGFDVYKRCDANFWLFACTLWGGQWILSNTDPATISNDGTINSTCNGWNEGYGSDNGDSGGRLLDNHWTPIGTVTGTPTTTAGNSVITPGWIRCRNRRLDAYAWAGSGTAMNAGAGQAAAITIAIGLVETTAYSWFYDPTTYKIHINAGGTNPSTLTWEWTDSDSTQHHGINIQRNGYVFGMRTDGWGCYAAGGTQQYWGIAFTAATAGDAALVENCQAYYNGWHNIGSTASQGHILTIINCVGGYLNDTGDGTTRSGAGNFVGYASLGGQELIAWNCQARFSSLPWLADSAVMGWRDHESVNFHCADYAHRGALLLVWGMRITGETGYHNATWGNGMYAPSDQAVNTNLPGTPGNLTSLRAWVVDCDYAVPSAPKCGNYITNSYDGGPSSRSVLINARQRLTLSASNAPGATATIYTGPGGFGWNEAIDILDPDGGPTGTRTLTTAGTAVHRAIRVRTANSATVVNLTGAGTMLNNSTDANRDPIATPVLGDALYGQGTSTAAVLGAALEYDINWAPRRAAAPSVGAMES